MWEGFEQHSLGGRLSRSVSRTGSSPSATNSHLMVSKEEFDEKIGEMEREIDFLKGEHGREVEFLFVRLGFRTRVWVRVPTRIKCVEVGERGKK